MIHQVVWAKKNLTTTPPRLPRYQTWLRFKISLTDPVHIHLGEISACLVGHAPLSVSTGFWKATSPSCSSPLLVLVNSKSGDNQGVKFLRKFKQQLNPAQVFDLMNGGPQLGWDLPHVIFNFTEAHHFYHYAACIMSNLFYWMCLIFHYTVCRWVRLGALFVYVDVYVCVWWRVCLYVCRLRLFQKFVTFRILVCGGDGSVGWVLSELDKLGLHKQVWNN